MRDADAVDEQLHQLQRQSERRTAELKAIAGELPSLVGRRAMLRMLLGDAIVNTNWSALRRRGWRRVTRWPSDVVHSVRSRGRRPPR